MDSPFMEALAAGICAHGITVARFEFPFMDQRRKTEKRAPPNRMPVLEASFRDAIAALGKQRRLFIGGKSMGGRVATMLADTLRDAPTSLRGVIALGYPFHPPGRPDKERTAHLRVLETPCLLVQGTRDTLGSRHEVESYALADTVRLHWIEDGDHSLEPRRRAGARREQTWAEAARAVASFIEGQRW